MQVEMAEAQDTEEVEAMRQLALDAALARTRELLSTSEEFRERVDRTVNESMTKIYTLLQLPRD